ncbi:MAG: prepilin-type N-terminal cleavage/methylation domain-containing protein [Bdellovibrionaceae bacterium]|nr:prepilin-type N-terminal cleavage/methylation domain-containing protein [Pseudobdellovibrionaceae bacterium]
MFQLSLRKNMRGASLIEILVSLAILGIVASGFLTVVINQQKQLHHVNQKQEVAELKAYLLSTFTNSDSCTCSLRPTDTAQPGPLVFDSNVVDGSQAMIIPKIVEGCALGAKNLAGAGELVPGTQTNLRVQDIRLVKIQPGGNPLEWFGYLQISFDPTSTPISLKPLQVKQRFTIDTIAPSVAANRLIKSCIATDRLEFGDYISIPTNVIQVAGCDGFLSSHIGGNGVTGEHAYICSGTDLAKVTECYGFDGGGPGAGTILSRMQGYAGTMGMIKKGSYYQVQYLGATNGAGGLYGWVQPQGSVGSKLICLTN